MTASSSENIFTPPKNGLAWHENHLVVLDQRQIPEYEIPLTFTRAQEIAHGINSGIIQGVCAPAIAAAYGIALSAIKKRHTSDWKQALKADFEVLGSTKTANGLILFILAELQKQLNLQIKQNASSEQVIQHLVQQAEFYHRQLIDGCRSIEEQLSHHFHEPDSGAIIGSAGLVGNAGGELDFAKFIIPSTSSYILEWERQKFAKPYQTITSHELEKNKIRYILIPIYGVTDRKQLIVEAEAAKLLNTKTSAAIPKCEYIGVFNHLILESPVTTLRQSDHWLKVDINQFDTVISDQKHILHPDLSKLFE